MYVNCFIQRVVIPSVADALQPKLKWKQEMEQKRKEEMEWQRKERENIIQQYLLGKRRKKKLNNKCIFCT